MELKTKQAIGVIATAIIFSGLMALILFSFPPQQYGAKIRCSTNHTVCRGMHNDCN